VSSDSKAHKQAAVDLHTRQAGEFAARYRAFSEDPYPSTFTYGRKKIEELIDRVTADFPAGTRALDVGCGTGFNLARLRDRGFQVAGLEPSPSMREEALANNPGTEIIDGDIESMPFADASFDLAIAIEVVRYLEDPARAFAELARVLRPGGTAIVSATPLLSIGGYALVHAVTSRVTVPTFQKCKQSFMTTASARRTARAAGFSSVDVHGAFLGPWHAVGRLSPRMLGWALRAVEPIDDLLSDRWPLRDLANHLVIVARR